MDEVLHTLMLSGTLQKKLEGFQIPVAIFNQALHCRRHGEFSVKEMCQCFYQRHRRGNKRIKLMYTQKKRPLKYFNLASGEIGVPGL